MINRVIVTSSDGVKFAVNTYARGAAQAAYAAQAEQKYAGMNTAAQLMQHSDFTLWHDDTLAAPEFDITPVLERAVPRRLTRADLRVIDGDRR